MAKSGFCQLGAFEASFIRANAWLAAWPCACYLGRGMPNVLASLSRDHPDFARRATGLAHVAARDVLRRFAEALRPAQIPVLAVKGIVTGQTLYADPAERPIADVDVRLIHKHIQIVREIGARHGWAILENSYIYRNVVFDINGILVDVEATVGPPGLCGLRVADMFQRASRENLDGEAVWFPELHDHALLLAVNVFKDKLVRAAPWAVEDLKRIALDSAFSPARLARLAETSSSSTLLWIVSDWMARSGATGAWSEVRGACAPFVRRGYARLYRRLVETSAFRPVLLPLVTRMASDRVLERVMAVGRAVGWQLGHLNRWS